MVRGAAGQAQVRVALPHGQVAGALLGVALGLAPTPGETVLTCGAGGGGAVTGCRDGGENGRDVLSHSELHWQNFSQKFWAVTQGQEESQGCLGWSQGW